MFNKCCFTKRDAYNKSDHNLIAIKLKTIWNKYKCNGTMKITNTTEICKNLFIHHSDSIYYKLI